MSFQSLLEQLGLAERHPNSLEAQLHAMRREVQRIGKSLSRQASHTTDDWADHLTDFSRDAVRQTGHLAHVAGQQARRGVEMVGRDPLPLLVVVGTGLLLARLLKH